MEYVDTLNWFIYNMVFGWTISCIQNVNDDGGGGGGYQTFEWKLLEWLTFNFIHLWSP